MQVAKWGDSLAVRLPAAVVEQLQLKEGDTLDIEMTSGSSATLRRTMTREEAIEALRKIQWQVEPGYRLRRQDAYEE